MSNIDCDKCKDSFSSRNFNRHYKSCNGQRRYSKIPQHLKNQRMCGPRKMKNIDWQQVQEYYNQNHSVKETYIHFKLSTNTMSKASKLGVFKARERVETALLRGTLGHKHTDESKQKISIGRIKFLECNPDYVWCNKPSYPERYWAKIFAQTDLPIIPEYRIRSYKLDFALIEQKIDIEIDGEQHYNHPAIVRSDIKRTSKLKQSGWRIIRIRWSEYKKLSKTNRKQFVLNLLTFLRGYPRCP